MKLNIQRIPTIEETTITIECSHVSQDIKRLASMIRNMEACLTGYQEKTYCKVPVPSIFYEDTVENRTFLYTESDTYSCQQKLYEIERHLSDLGFIRISKNTIVNLHQIDKVKSIGISKLELILLNQERLVVNRNYLQHFKQAFMTGGRI